MLRRRKPRLTPEQVLGSVPMRNKALKTERIEGGGIKLVLPRRRQPARWRGSRSTWRARRTRRRSTIAKH